MKKARLIITTACVRKCEYCCNTPEMLKSATVLTNYDQLYGYNEVMITGGEPLMDRGNFESCLVKVFNATPLDTKLYLYSASYRGWLKKWFGLLDGIHYTLHTNPTEQDLEDFDLLQEHLLRENLNRRLSIIAGCKETIHIHPKSWDWIRYTQWIDDCSLPKDEKLFILGGC